MEINRGKVIDFLIESNHIENERSGEAHDDAIDAWDYIQNKKKLNVSDIKEIHKILMQRLRPDIAGKWRDCDVYIGGDKRTFISKEVLDSQMDAVCREINTQIKGHRKIALPHSEIETLCQRLHVDFEIVHPFEDGNGRVGRIIYNWNRIQMGFPIHVIHEGEEQMNYYKWFKNDV